ncbi:MAG: SEC-C metal-binding domain-containing protein [Patescibacteria group bacterium]
MVEREIEQFVYYHTGGTAAQDWNIKEIYETAVTIFPIHASEKDELLSLHSKGNGRLDEAIARTEIIEFLVKLAKTRYEELKKQINNPELMLEVEKGMLLRSIDTLWVEHLVAIDYLRVGIGLRGYGQRDPLVEYKKEAYRLFNELVSSIQKEVVYSIYKVGIGLDLAPSLMERQGIRMTGAQKEAGATPLAPPKEFSHTDAGAKVGRNDLCPCGSGKKYKKCHGQ